MFEVALTVLVVEVVLKEKRTADSEPLQTRFAWATEGLPAGFCNCVAESWPEPAAASSLGGRRRHLGLPMKNSLRPFSMPDGAERGRRMLLICGSDESRIDPLKVDEICPKSSLLPMGEGTILSTTGNCSVSKGDRRQCSKHLRYDVP